MEKKLGIEVVGGGGSEEAQASIKIPSTLKCSSLKSPWALVCSNTRYMNLREIPPQRNLWRFLVNVVASHTGSSMLRPTNQRKSKL